MGLPSPSGRGADVGNITHKALELFAREKKARQDGEASFVEPDSGREFKTGEVTAELGVDHGWSIYAKPKYGPKDKQECLDMTYHVLLHEGGEWHPGNHHVIQPEQYFDLEVPGAWAAYRFDNPHGGPPLEGRLRQKGTMDLIVRDLDFGFITYADWKTGRPFWSWEKGREKTYDDLMEDQQLLLYYRALRTLYPGEHPLMMIYFVRAGFPTYLPYGDEQLDVGEEKLRKAFDQIANDENPKRKMDECGPRGQPCSFCHFNKTKAENGQSLCDYYHGQLQQLGMPETVRRHGRPDALTGYGSGGGVQNRE